VYDDLVAVASEQVVRRIGLLDFEAQRLLIERGDPILILCEDNKALLEHGSGFRIGGVVAQTSQCFCRQTRFVLHRNVASAGKVWVHPAPPWSATLALAARRDAGFGTCFRQRCRTAMTALKD